MAVSSVPPYSSLASWDFARPCGLRCYAATGATNSSYLHVTAVALDPAGYFGALPVALLSSLPFLASLVHLDVSGNALSGSLLGALGRCRRRP